MATPIESTSPRPEQTNGQRHATPDVYVYLGVLSVLFLIPGNLSWTPLQFIYKDQLHLTANQTGIFKFLINVPGMAAFLFGIVRDRYNPLKMGDRGFILFSGIAVCAVFAAMSSIKLTVFSLGVGLVLSGIAGGMLGAAFNALMRNISDARMMSGRLSTLWNFVALAIPALVGYLSGWLTDHMSWRTIFLLVAAFYGFLALLGLWKPLGVLEGIPSGGSRSFAQLGEDAKKLAKHRGFWIAVLLNGVWAFTPAAGTPFQYFFTDNLKGSATQFALFNSMYSVGFIPFLLLFGALSKRISLWKMLLISSVVAIPQWFPVMYIHTINQAYFLSIFAGATGSLATAAYFALVLRACPQNLAGTGMLLNSGVSLLLAEGGNVLGGFLYSRWGFPACAWVTTGAYALLFPMCFLLPRALVDPPDDKPVPTEEELIAA